MAVSLYAEARIARYVHRTSFYPVPDVDSAIVLMRPRPTRPPIDDYDRFNSLLRLLFSQRNKLLMGVLRRAAEKGLIPRVEEASLRGLGKAMRWRLPPIRGHLPADRRVEGAA
ncbi:hypothetical protein B6U99_06825 [Candidatus Geothermarchaeota archaeon ex4572_27]|nr:MAG: hypothetical protein B6U99_06825 [Candidatus Geothermarchaeota archaeon ex4572_27]